MTESYLVIADIAGQFDALERLANRMPDEKIILVGDLVDRGHESFEVVEWAMKTPRVTTLMGNHEHMMWDYYTNFGVESIYGDMDGQPTWTFCDARHNNGGGATKASYSRHGFKRPPQEHLDWIGSLPLYFKTEDGKMVVTHAPIEAGKTLEDAHSQTLDFVKNGGYRHQDGSLLWCRTFPSHKPYLQIFGHNSGWGLHPFYSKDEETIDEIYAICIDQSYKEILTGFHWPTYEILEEPYLRSSKPSLV